MRGDLASGVLVTKMKRLVAMHRRCFDEILSLLGEEREEAARERVELA
jgi:hypothetical protein